MRGAGRVLLAWGCVVLGVGCRGEAPRDGGAEGAVVGGAMAGAVAGGGAAAGGVTAGAAAGAAAGAVAGGAVAGGGAAGGAVAGDPGKQAKKSAMDGLLIRQDFERQDRVALPPGLPGWMTGLAPDDPQVKVVEVALARRMEQTQPVAGRRALMMRWVTTRRGEALDAMVAAALRAGGWVSGEGPVTSPISDPSRGTVSWTVSAPAQRAAWVRFEVVDADPAGALALPVEWLRDAPAWAAAVKGEAPVGFEFRHYHARRPGTVYSDLENLVGAFRPAAVPAFVDGLYGALRAAGFEADDDDPRLMRGPGPSSFTARTLPDGAVVIHHQRRWARPEAGAAGTAGVAGKAGAAVEAGAVEAGAEGKAGEPAAGGARPDR